MNFKQLTRQNWDQPDETSAVFVRLTPEAGVEPMDGADWAHEFLAVELSEAVPPDVRALFAVAQGTLLYGWFFYPLYMLGQEQLYRVADAATAHRYRELKGLSTAEKIPAFAGRIKELVGIEIITEELSRRWDAIRELRNIGSHPEMQMLQPPGVALDSLRLVAESVNGLFSDSSDSAVS